MINITITNPNLESLLHQAYGDNMPLIEAEFARFIQETRIKQDIDIALQQLQTNESVLMEEAFKTIRSKYEEGI
jgi:hypothetical protein